MRVAAVAVLILVVAVPAVAQRRVDLIFDVEGVRRAERVSFVPNTVQYIPEFDEGGGLGGGVNLFFSDRVSLELKVAGLASRLRVRRTGSDFVTTADLGYAQIYPITAVLQWHMLEHGSFRPYIGAGAGHIILRNIEKDFIGLTGVEFDDPTGLVVNGGVRIPFSSRWAAYGDARYTPIETQARARFIGAPNIEEIDVRPLIVSFGLAYSF
jgi:outer membrane protein